jgi:hypothetical protein
MERKEKKKKKKRKILGQRWGDQRGRHVGHHQSMAWLRAASGRAPVAAGAACSAQKLPSAALPLPARPL